jgi:ADP-ribosylglycohydrolase
MLGAIAGDIIGSRFEHRKALDFQFQLIAPGCQFTDDTVLTLALADSIINEIPYVDKLKEYYRLYPYAGYGGAFKNWAKSADTQPYFSFGNGSAMRVSPIGFAYNDLETVLKQAAYSAEVTHNHPEGIKGAQAIAASIFWARNRCSKDEIMRNVETQFGYQLNDSVEHLHQHYQFDVTCQGSVPQAIIAFVESENFEDAIRKAIYIGGDSDTIACMAGGIAHAYYGGVPEEIRNQILAKLDDHLRNIFWAFHARYPSL